MPTNLTYSGARIPNQNEGGDPSADFARFGGDIDQKLNLPATSQSDRDTKYTGTSANAFVVSAAIRTGWLRTSSGWVTAFEENDPVTTGIVTAAANFSVSSQWAQRRNGFVTVAAVLTYSGSTVTAGSGGQVAPDVPVCTVQSTYRPPTGLMSVGIPVELVVGTVSGTGYLNTGGAVSILSMASNSSLTAGSAITLYAIFPGA